MISFELEPKLLRACAPAMSREKSRPQLNGVHIFERNGSLVYEATNGIFLVRIKSNHEQIEDIAGLNIIIPDFFVKELGKTSFLKGFGCIGLEWVHAFVEGQSIKIEMPEGVATKKLIEGKFPDTAPLFPTKRSCKDLDFDAIGANFEYAGAIAKSLRQFSGSSSTEIRLSDKNGPIHMSLRNEIGDWEALLMPTQI